ncbi:MAG: aldo/keto reductase [Steroidobacteraceae bacterium]
MQYRLLGRTGIKVSELSLGTMTFGTEFGFGAEEAASRSMFDYYLEQGGNFIDTANLHNAGSSETYLGRFIGASRSRIVLATKFTMSGDAGNINAGGSSRKSLHLSLHNSLRRLQTDYIDLLWVHMWDSLTGIEELLRALDDVVRQGKVLSIGFSNYPAWVVARASEQALLRNLSVPVALQVQYSLVERNVEHELLPCAAQYGMTITAWSPLAGGFLSGKYSADPAVRAKQSGRLQTASWGSLYSDRNFAIAAAVAQVARECGRSSAQVALRWLMQRPGNVLPIIGARTLEQLRDIMQSAEFTLSSEQLAALDGSSAPAPHYPQSLLASPRLRGMMHGSEIDRLR